MQPKKIPLFPGEHLALHDRGLNLVQRVNPLAISKQAICDAQRICAAHYGQTAPSVLIQTPHPDITTTYVDEFLHRNIYELLKNSMRATCDAHLQGGSPVTIAMSSSSSSLSLSGRGDNSCAAETKKGSSPTARSAMPPVTLTLVDGGEDVTIKIMDQGGGLALSDMDNLWSYVNSVKSRPQDDIPTMTTTGTATATTGSSTSTATADSLATMGGVASEVKDYLDMPLHGSGHGLPLARLIARYFGGDLSLISMEGYGTDSYLSLYRNDDHLENFPEVDEEMQAEVDVFVRDLMVESGDPRIGSNNSRSKVDEQSSLLQLKTGGPVATVAAAAASVAPAAAKPVILKPTHSSVPAGMALGLRQVSAVAAVAAASAAKDLSSKKSNSNKLPSPSIGVPPTSPTAESTIL